MISIIVGNESPVIVTRLFPFLEIIQHSAKSEIFLKWTKFTNKVISNKDLKRFPEGGYTSEEN